MLALPLICGLLLLPLVDASNQSDNREATVDIPKFVLGSQVFPERDRIWESALSDLDGDGDPDLILTSLGSGTAVLLNDGAGLFVETEQMFESGTHGIAVGDLDGDGDKDLFFALLRGGSAIYENDGRARFTRTNAQLAMEPSEIVHLVDLDDDGDLDAYLWWKHVLYRNDGTGVFSKSDVELPRSNSFCDLNGDGVSDVLSVEPGLGFTVHLNDKSGHFRESLFVANKSLTFCYTGFGDLDNDGDTDVIFTNGNDKTKWPAGVLFNDGTGRLTKSAVQLASVAYGFVGVGDLNDDGWLDVVLTDRTRPPTVWINDRGRTFINADIHLGNGGNWNNCIISDIDMDGDNDIFVTKVFGGSCAVWFNQLEH